MSTPDSDVNAARGGAPHRSLSIARRSALLGLGLVAVLAAGCSGKAKTAALPPEEAQRLLLDRNWLDRLPESPSDRLHVFRFVPSMGGGVYQDRTLYAGTFELFTFEHDGQHIRFHLHHTGQEASAGYTIDRLAGDGPLELHLHIADSPRGPQDYYSIRGMQAAGEAALESGLRSLFQKPAR
ncbi:MAG: hypothetical protein U1A78_10550 [Polyangia bacterium]